MNEDLEEIGDSGLNFGFNHAVDEIWIPKSVQSIGKYGVSSFRKIYLYRTTMVDLFGYSNNGVNNFVYLD